MNNHDFFNLLQGNVALARVRNFPGVHEYSEDYIKRYNESCRTLEALSDAAAIAIEHHDKLQKENGKIV